jgi:hypothetical protein
LEKGELQRELEEKQAEADAQRRKAQAEAAKEEEEKTFAMLKEEQAAQNPDEILAEQKYEEQRMKEAEAADAATLKLIAVSCTHTPCTHTPCTNTPYTHSYTHTYVLIHHNVLYGRSFRSKMGRAGRRVNSRHLNRHSNTPRISKRNGSKKKPTPILRESWQKKCLVEGGMVLAATAVAAAAAAAAVAATAEAAAAAAAVAATALIATVVALAVTAAAAAVSTMSLCPLMKSKTQQQIMATYG